MKKALRLAAALLVSLLAAAYVVEIYLVLDQRDHAGRLIRAAARVGVEPDLRAVGEVVADLRGQGVDAQPFFRIINRARGIMPLGNTPGRTIVFCNELGRYMVFRADRHGFNNPDAVWDRPSIELALLGDSFVQGACEPDGKGFANLLRADVPALLNLGMGGNEPQLDLATLREYAAPMHVKVALWFHYTGNDLTGMMVYRRHALLERYVTGEFSQDLLHRTDEAEKAMSEFYAAHADEVRDKASPDALLPAFEWTRILRLATLRARLGLTFGVAELDFERFARVVDSARVTAERANIRLAFVIIPTESQLADGAADPVFAATERILRASGLPVFDLRAPFRGAGADAVYAFGPEGGHLSTQGNEIVAGYLRTEILPSLGVPQRAPSEASAGTD
jgi:hypothetical protein